MGVSIVIPIGPNEQEPTRLVQCLKLFPPDCVEFIFVSADDVTTFPGRALIDSELNDYALQWLVSGLGRAKQQNCGARAAKYSWLWFLHIDSGFDEALVQSLLNVISRKPSSSLVLYCFRLAFYPHSLLMPLNSWGANLRTRFFKLPFGDQGFLLSTDAFKTLGCFDESTSYGEDHLLAWKVIHLKGRVRLLPETIVTSARKYYANGWLQQTTKHQYLWLAQCLPQIKLYLFNK